MKFTGVLTSTTPVDSTPGVFEAGFNPRLRVEGELRRRRGLARTNIAKVTGPITLIGGFGQNQDSDFAVIAGPGTIDGAEDPLALWNDASLIPLAGGANLWLGVYTLRVNRNSCEFMTSALVFAQRGRYPTDVDPGVFVEEIEFEPEDTQLSTTYTPTDAGTWYFRAYPVRNRVIGPGVNLTPTANPPILVAATMEMFVTHFGMATGTLDMCSAPAAYFTAGPGISQFAYGQALEDGVITLPYVFTIGNSGAITCELLFAFSNFYGGVDFPKLYGGGPTPAAGTVTIATSGIPTLS